MQFVFCNPGEFNEKCPFSNPANNNQTTNDDNQLKKSCLGWAPGNATGKEAKMRCCAKFYLQDQKHWLMEHHDENDKVRNIDSHIVLCPWKCWRTVSQEFCAVDTIKKISLKQDKGHWQQAWACLCKLVTYNVCKWPSFQFFKATNHISTSKRKSVLNMTDCTRQKSETDKWEPV